MYRIFLNFAKNASYPLRKNSIIKKKFHPALFEILMYKLKLGVFSAGDSVAMVTYSVTKIIPTCSPVIGQFFDTMIVYVASIDKEWL